MARTWIDRCRKDHKLCSRTSELWYPTRLLHIDRRTQKVRLIVSKSHSLTDPYITLSHRWEKNIPVKLQSSTIAQFQTEIVTSSLTQAFQDAITIAHHLGFNYLWIDALCIEQDGDEVDWNIESQNMDRVYSNAFLNLSATMASTGEEPLLLDRLSGPLQPSGTKLFNSTRENYYIMDSQMWSDEIDDAPLNQRAWVFQERFLARRILHFGPRQLAWECHECEALEMFPDGLYQFSTLLSMTKSRTYNILSRPPQETHGTETGIETGKFVDGYHNLVHNYSRCHLTRSKDKLIAFLGIPKSIQKTRVDTYIAGVWNRTLPFDLAWYCYDIERCNLSVSKVSFQAPSWSWASASGPVNFPEVSNDVKKIFITNWMFVQQSTQTKDYFIDKTSIRLQGFLYRWNGWTDIYLIFRSSSFTSIERRCFHAEDQR